MWSSSIVYKDYSYEPDHENDGDVVKTYHDVYQLDVDSMGTKHGKKRICSMPLGPYDSVNFRLFQMWVDCGMPTREQIKSKGNATAKDIIAYYDKWIDDKIDSYIFGDDNV
jgi:hypothetical protein